MNVKNILASLSRLFVCLFVCFCCFFAVKVFYYSFEACFNFNLIIVRISHCKRKKTMVFLKEQSSHATTRLLGGWRATFHTSIASEIRDEACDCRTPLFFLCRSLNQSFISQIESYLFLQISFSQYLGLKIVMFERTLLLNQFPYSMSIKSLMH